MKSLCPRLSVLSFIISLCFYKLSVMQVCNLHCFNINSREVFSEKQFKDLFYSCFCCSIIFNLCQPFLIIYHKILQSSCQSESSILNEIKWQGIYQSIKHFMSKLFKWNFYAYNVFNISLVKFYGHAHFYPPLFILLNVVGEHS